MKNHLLKALSSFSLEDVLELERHDRQYRALERLFLKLKDEELFLKLLVVNALMSYQLQMKGERYWEAFSDFFSGERGISDFPEFIERFNRRLLKSKLKRLERVIGCTERAFREGYERFGRNAATLTAELSSCLGQKPDSKTISFAAKMFAYGWRICRNALPEGLESVSIPIDVRISRVSGERGFWRKLSEKLGIPMAHLDTLIWVPMGMEERDVDELPERLKGKVENLRKLLQPS